MFQKSDLRNPRFWRFVIETLFITIPTELPKEFWRILKARKRTDNIRLLFFLASWSLAAVFSKAAATGIGLRKAFTVPMILGKEIAIIYWSCFVVTSAVDLWINWNLFIYGYSRILVVLGLQNYQQQLMYIFVPLSTIAFCYTCDRAYIMKFPVTKAELWCLRQPIVLKKFLPKIIF